MMILFNAIHGQQSFIRWLFYWNCDLDYLPMLQ